jgi:arginine deiminase
VAITAVQQATQPAEWDEARVVLVSRPSIETLFGVLNTDAANFLRPFDLDQARVEHDGFRRAMEARGVRVVDLRDALTGGDLDALRGAASASLRYELDSMIGDEDRAELGELHRHTIATLGPRALADVVMLRPVLKLRPNPHAPDRTCRFLPTFEVRPADNAYFTRDPMITTAAGAVIGRMNLAVRRPENDVAALVLGGLGITPLLRVAPPGFLEGGDFLPAGSFCLQGQGLLSDADGIGQLLDAGAYGEVEVAIVRDPRCQMDEMHLDTYFALYGRHLAGICDDRLGADQPEVDVWVPEETPSGRRYRKTRTLGFLAYLAEKHVEVLTFTKDEQREFAANGLLLGPMDYLAVAQAGEAFLDRLRARGVRVEPIEYRALTGGYGGPHCSSQVLVRAERFGTFDRAPARGDGPHGA